MFDEGYAQAKRGVLSEEHQRGLVSLGQVKRWQSGAVILTAGECSGHVLLIRRGQVKVWALSEHGDVVVLAVRGPGELIGEYAALDGRPRSATVTALTSLEAAVITGQTFRRFLLATPEVALELITTLLARVRESDGARVEFASYPVGQRVARRLSLSG